VAATFRWRHAAWLKEVGIRSYTGARIVLIEDRAVRFLDREGEEVALKADTIVLGAPRRSRNGLIPEMEYSVDELYAIGDAVFPRSLPDAIHGGYRLAARI